MAWYSESGWWEVIVSLASIFAAYTVGRIQQQHADERVKKREAKRDTKISERVMRQVEAHVFHVVRCIPAFLEIAGLWGTLKRPSAPWIARSDADVMMTLLQRHSDDWETHLLVGRFFSQAERLQTAASANASFLQARLRASLANPAHQQLDPGDESIAQEYAREMQRAAKQLRELGEEILARGLPKVAVVS